MLHSLWYAYRDRRNRKRDLRRLWIARINAAARLNGTTYSRLMNGAEEGQHRAQPQDAGRSGRARPGSLQFRVKAALG